MADSNQEPFKIIRLANGAHTVHSVECGESFHPGIGPESEAEALYVRQLNLPDCVARAAEEFVVWDVGLGAAANVLTALKRISDRVGEERSLRIVSFDRTSNAAAFALRHAAELGYVLGWEDKLAGLIEKQRVNFRRGSLAVDWGLELGDFPARLASTKDLPAPHAILFDPHSPKRNPEMWTVSLFATVFNRLDPERPCLLATFSRSTMARAAMLLGGFFVGVGHPTGFKDETTLAANQRELLTDSLNARWLERAERSDSAEPLREAVYRQQNLSPGTLEELRRHPQFR